MVFADPTQSMFLADMSGDGLTDIVRIFNGEVVCWPNLGYGCFGPKLTMDNSPRLADIDGSISPTELAKDIRSASSSNSQFTGP